MRHRVPCLPTRRGASRLTTRRRSPRSRPRSPPTPSRPPLPARWRPACSSPRWRRLLAASAVLVITAVRLLGSGDARLDLGGPPAVLLAVAFAAGNVAALLFLTRDWAPPRVVTVALAFVVAMAWPLSGIPLPAAAAGDRRRRARARPRPARRRRAPRHRVGPARRLRRGRRRAGDRRRRARRVAPREAAKPAALSDAAPTGERPNGVARRHERRAATTRRRRASATSERDRARVATAKPRPPSRPERTTGRDAKRPTGATGERRPATTPSRAPAGADAARPKPTGEHVPPAEADDPRRRRAGADARSPPRRRTARSPTARRSRRPGRRSPTPNELRPRVLPRARREALRRRLGLALARGQEAVRRVRRVEGGLRHDALQQAARPHRHRRRHRRHGQALLIARDTDCAGERRFSVTWTLRRVSEQWSVIGLTAAAVGANTAKCR